MEVQTLPWFSERISVDQKFHYYTRVELKISDLVDIVLF